MVVFIYFEIKPLYEEHKGRLLKGDETGLFLRKSETAVIREDKTVDFSHQRQGGGLVRGLSLSLAGFTNC